MINDDKKLFIHILDEVINSKRNKLTKKELQNLVVVREGIKMSKSKSKILKLLSFLKDIFDPDE
jgi:hypothetical protein